jgi:hypothetical protein
MSQKKQRVSTINKVFWAEPKGSDPECSFQFVLVKTIIIIIIII